VKPKTHGSAQTKLKHTWLATYTGIDPRNCDVCFMNTSKMQSLSRGLNLLKNVFDFKSSVAIASANCLFFGPKFPYI